MMNRILVKILSQVHLMQINLYTYKIFVKYCSNKYNIAESMIAKVSDLKSLSKEKNILQKSLVGDIKFLDI